MGRAVSDDNFYKEIIRCPGCNRPVPYPDTYKHNKKPIFCGVLCKIQYDRRKENLFLKG